MLYQVPVRQLHALIPGDLTSRVTLIRLLSTYTPLHRSIHRIRLVAQISLHPHPSNIWFLGPYVYPPPNGISIDSALCSADGRNQRRYRQTKELQDVSRNSPHLALIAAVRAKN